MLYAFDNRRPRIGEGTYVSEHALVIGDVVIGDHCYIGHGVILRGDYGTITIGPGTAVEEGVIVHAPPDELSEIGEKVTIGHGATVHSALIGDLAVIGMGAILSIRSRVGGKSIVAEGAVVRENQVIPPGVVVRGNPAQVVRAVAEKDLERWAWAKQLYIDLAAKYLAIGMEPLPDEMYTGGRR